MKQINEVLNEAIGQALEQQQLAEEQVLRSTQIEVWQLWQEAMKCGIS